MTCEVELHVYHVMCQVTCVWCGMSYHMGVILCYMYPVTCCVRSHVCHAMCPVTWFFFVVCHVTCVWYHHKAPVSHGVACMAYFGSSNPSRSSHACVVTSVLTCVPCHMFAMSHVHHVTCLPCHMCTMSYVCHVTCVPCHMFAMSHVYHVTCVPCHMCTMSYVCHVTCVHV